MVRELHPVATIFPEMAEHEYASLVKSVDQHGLLHPILLHPDGRIIDGRHRDRACREAGVEPRYTTYNGPLDDESLAKRVWAENADRRQLTKQQRDLAAARIASLRRGRPIGGGATEGNDSVTGSNNNSSNELITSGEHSVSLEEAAKITGTTHAGAKRAKDVINAREKGSHPGLESHLERGHLSTNAAAELARSGHEDLLSQLDEDDSKEAAEKAAKELRDRRAREKLDEMVPEPDRRAYREEMAKKPSERDQSRTIVPLPNTTDEDEEAINEMKQQAVVTRLLSVISGASTSLKHIIDKDLNTELITDGNRDAIAEHVKMIRVHLDYLAALGDGIALDDELRGLQ